MTDDAKTLALDALRQWLRYAEGEMAARGGVGLGLEWKRRIEATRRAIEALEQE